MNDRSQGGSSLKDGEVELMFARNWSGEDQKGIPQSNMDRDISVTH